MHAGIPMADEPAILAKAIQLVQEVVDVPLAIDSSIVAAFRCRFVCLSRQTAGQFGNW